VFTTPRHIADQLGLTTGSVTTLLAQYSAQLLINTQLHADRGAAIGDSE
jgi:hypothetical protein